MTFTRIDLEHWKRREHYEFFLHEAPCSYSMTVQLDVTPIFERGERLQVAMLFYLSYVANHHKEFRMHIDEEGCPGYFDYLVPQYTIFHKENHTFSGMWTEYKNTYEAFEKEYDNDQKLYGHHLGAFAKPHRPPNILYISTIPWVAFDSLNLNFQKAYGELLPMLTMGECQEKDGKKWLPLAVQVHHSACDGYHVGRFLKELRDVILHGVAGD